MQCLNPEDFAFQQQRHGQEEARSTHEKFRIEWDSRRQGIVMPLDLAALGAINHAEKRETKRGGTRRVTDEGHATSRGEATVRAGRSLQRNEAGVPQSWQSQSPLARRKQFLIRWMFPPRPRFLGACPCPIPAPCRCRRTFPPLNQQRSKLLLQALRTGIPQTSSEHRNTWVSRPLLAYQSLLSHARSTRPKPRNSSPV